MTDFAVFGDANCFYRDEVRNLVKVQCIDTNFPISLTIEIFGI